MDPLAAKYIGAGLAALGMIGAGLGVGNVWASYFQAIARNPAAKNEIGASIYIGFAVTEAIALFALVVGLIILFA
ncbi:F0F1 ATP synthase subunit C [Roseiterribacter gracilis]|jgi:F0F1-type ATP synthase membrane subunit c/vacuolar-type H+-ATPase subunit K|uniref:ATP synthase subunit c n=1 Tax=Roseiterribacter gracilis TaxID=2812848 RepID=A0A8S8X858_9PROT|nr:ATP synthase subunit c [Rhodospirillales bacterium TMPK1]